MRLLRTWRLLTSAIALQAVTAMGQGLLADQWISNCVANEEGPNGIRAAELTGKKVFTHRENIAYCVTSWNAFHPDQRVQQNGKQ